MYDFVGDTIRQTAALGFLGSKVPKIPKRVKRRVEIWMTGEQRTSRSPSLAVESEQLLGVIRMAAVNHEARYYMLRKDWYTASRAEDMQHRGWHVLVPGLWSGMRLRRWIQTDISIDLSTY